MVRRICETGLIRAIEGVSDDDSDESTEKWDVTD